MLISDEIFKTRDAPRNTEKHERKIQKTLQAKQLSMHDGDGQRGRCARKRERERKGKRKGGKKTTVRKEEKEEQRIEAKQRGWPRRIGSIQNTKYVSARSVCDCKAHFDRKRTAVLKSTRES